MTEEDQSNKNLEARDAIIAEYSSLRAEILERIGVQKTVISWLITLTGAFLGFLLVRELPGQNVQLFSLTFKKLTSEILIYLAILCGGYVVAVEILITYSIYQLYMVFRLSNFIVRLDKRIKNILSFKKDFPLFAWDRESKGLADIDINKLDKDTIRCLRIAARFDVVSPIAMAAIGLVGLGFISIISICKFELTAFIVSILLFILLSFSLYFLYHVDYNVHKFAIGPSGSRDIGMFANRKVISRGKTLGKNGIKS